MEFNTVVFIVFTLLALLSLKASVQIVPQSENWLVERLGKYNRTMEAGLHFLIPFSKLSNTKSRSKNVNCRLNRLMPLRLITSQSRFH